jgi:hypothetical protein
MNSLLPCHIRLFRIADRPPYLWWRVGSTTSRRLCQRREGRYRAGRSQELRHAERDCASQLAHAEIDETKFKAHFGRGLRLVEGAKGALVVSALLGALDLFGFAYNRISDAMPEFLAPITGLSRVLFRAGWAASHPSVRRGESEPFVRSRCPSAGAVHLFNRSPCRPRWSKSRPIARLQAR